MPRVVHFEIPVDDPERAARFYREAFGWRVEGWEGPMEYWLCSTGDVEEPGIDGALTRREGRAPEDGGGISLAVSVASADDAAARVAAAGGTIVQPKSPIPGVGWVVAFADTEGNLLSAMQDDPTAGT